MSMLPIEELVYDDGRTKQSFKDSTDINKILKKAQKTGSLSHVQKYDSAVYGEFQGYDLLEAHGMVTRAQEIFDDLPSEIRNEFGNDAFKFAGFASDPENIDRLQKLLPAIAEPGPYFPNPVKRGDEPPAAPQGAQGGSANSPPPGSGTGESSAAEGAGGGSGDASSGDAPASSST